MNIVELVPPQRANIIADMEKLLELAKAGRLTGYCGMFTIDDMLNCQTTESWFITIAQAQLLSSWAEEKFRNGPP